MRFSELTSEADLMVCAHEDPRFIIESGFWVINKEKDIVPFVFNEVQNMFYDERSSRDDILKASQLGLSTEILAILTVKFLLVPHCWSVSISHEAEATGRLFEKVKFFLAHLPPWLQRYYIPGEENSKSISNLYWSGGTETGGSKFYIGTAGAIAFGRGDTIHYAHLSETSRWRDDGSIETGIIRAVPLNDPHTWIVKETTANGQGNHHHQEWVREQTPGQSAFKPHFIAWFENPEYDLPGQPIEEGTMDEEEQHLVAQHPEVTMTKLAWRRLQISTLTSEKGRSPEEMFKQEFPSDPAEAFLFSGDPVFPVTKIQNYKDKARKPLFRGKILGVVPNEKLDEDKHGNLKIFETPTPEDRYIIFGDTAQFNDRCSACVVNQRTWKTAAVFNGVLKAHQFASELNKIGYFFNKALIAVEVNNMGQSTIDKLVDLGYPNLYMRQRMDKKTKEVTDEYGWYTTQKTKSLIIGHMQELLRNEEIDLPDGDTLDEFLVFVRHPDGTMGASKGSYDDRVIATCGAYYILKLNPIASSAVSKSKRPVNKASKFKKFRSAGRRNK